ncbi:nucleotidyltransferase domain-containing protein [Luteimonas sp. SJ-92]|uniref:Nucleotidyltransferase domain-containing protein n=1 Tax=Luteimonas salinisoli TaxID=2752307 RepID=A0A853JIF0_9GAMM|nr:nucleotidyltransferase domain-containing protein [Luteimonas salinisoli]NZA28359.1 nucleotidyltransferase domain-containing protein [Luteimonas salinisoli]
MALQIERFRPGIAELCRKYRVSRLDLFGSSVGDDFDLRRSDLDFLVDFVDTGPEGAADRYFGLQESLQGLMGRPVDLVVRRAIHNPYFLDSAERQHLNLYAA